MNLTPVLPESLPVNIEGLRPFLSIKRINPATGVPFRHGEVREDGRRFWGYRSIVAKRTGLLRENWLTFEAFEKIAAHYKSNVKTIAAYKARYRAANVKTISAYKARYRAANVKTIAAYRAEYYNANVETIAAQQAVYRAANVEKVAAQRAVYRAANAKQLAANQVQYAKDNPGKVNARNARRRAAKLQRTPPWLTKQDLADIAKIYELCAERTRVTGVPHTVDHILPLQGRTVSGLHIAANLQIITASENCSKNNKYVQE